MRWCKIPYIKQDFAKAVLLLRFLRQKLYNKDNNWRELIYFHGWKKNTYSKLSILWKKLFYDPINFRIESVNVDPNSFYHPKKIFLTIIYGMIFGSVPTIRKMNTDIRIYVLIRIHRNFKLCKKKKKKSLRDTLSLPNSGNSWFISHWVFFTYILENYGLQFFWSVSDFSLLPF